MTESRRSPSSVSKRENGAGKPSSSPQSECCTRGWSEIISQSISSTARPMHLRAFTGQWSQQVLSEPFPSGNMNIGGNPVAGDDFALYTSGRRAYAFSALTGTWETLDVEEGATAVGMKGPSHTALVVGGSRLYSFDPKAARFQEVEAEED